METTSEKNWATFIHLSTLSQYCIPFGNYIFPILIWSSKKEKSEYIDYNGKQVLNFQLSMFLYSLLLGLIAVPILVITIFKSVPLHAIINKTDSILNYVSNENLSGIIIVALVAVFAFIGLKITEFFLIILGAVKTSNGETFKYPLTIHFIK